MEKTNTVLQRVLKMEPVSWVNNQKEDAVKLLETLPISFMQIKDAGDRLQRFAPFLKKAFPETEDGIIESPLCETPNLKEAMETLYKHKINGRFFVKCDSELQVAGSIKARGGIYEVLKHAEELALEEKLLSPDDDYSVFYEPRFRHFFSQYKVAVGSTGNLGMSIGIISATLGFQVTVHMSRDAKEWKKSFLRNHGVIVKEYDDDYSKAVEEGRKECAKDPRAYFVDDENSVDLFLGYAVAAFRLEKQLKKYGIVVDDLHPLQVYLPCGVGGAPGGIAFGLKHLFGDAVRCYFVEPTHAPCMLLGMLKNDDSIRVSDCGIDGVTEADGLAVGSPSKLVMKLERNLIEGIYTIEDKELYRLLALLYDTEEKRIEPSGAASIKGPLVTPEIPAEGTHIAWLTGGLFLPDDLFNKMYAKGKGLR
ncbi:MAG: D-serine ammonia-lyase [Aminobacterium sp.]|jgi:D-serine dehydratase|uniref:D-serine ammonia-lyase n=1 Tax=Aminobacterium sp. TaxID=1872491 RepID=UPI001BCA84A0|nr:D-serine ammonia-lyase [Aminobacterium sp.]MDD2206430.1 D-serine ammonia-lyase [Aminobacterium sp.]MDD3426692.1 D-serine ammonia-lyase [Aminobacterium sp.]MDD3706921.1 D-serine ammonia-lyase [Aminobacterium sp.]MDD4228235.1 D-serine ammonia-lyase [Aminobacterium sp.]MDD4551272.1 D-serine ammonia-lyase [Aminobacterium sp.]